MCTPGREMRFRMKGGPMTTHRPPKLGRESSEIGSLLTPRLPLRRGDAARVARSLGVEHGKLETDRAVCSGTAARVEQSCNHRRPRYEPLERRRTPGECEIPTDG